MSRGAVFGWLGAAVGGVVGFFIGGVSGAFLGASIGFALGGLFAPKTSDVKSPYQPDSTLQLPSNRIGACVFDGLGTVKVTGGQLLFYGRSRAEPQYEKTSTGGKGGGKKQKTLTGYKYYCSWGIGLLAGPVGVLYTVLKDNDEVIWEGELQRPPSGESETVVIDSMGSVQFFFGTGEQTALADVANVISDPTFNIPYRGLCWAYFQDCCLGVYNRVPTLSFVIRKTPVFSFSDKQVIQILDYNPMSAFWYILAYLSKLPESWLHTGDFTIVAEALYLESRGISVLFSSQQSAQSWLEGINEHIDNILRYGSDGKFHPKLIRNDYNPATLPMVDESILLDKPSFNRKSWIDTINEVRTQYSEITGRPESFVEGPYLIGWYKVDEGSELIVQNSATDGSLGGGLLPDLDVLGSDPPTFWAGLPGFGYTYEVGNTESKGYAAKDISPARTIGHLTNRACWGVFFKRINPNEGAAYGNILSIVADVSNMYGIRAWEHPVKSCAHYEQGGYDYYISNGFPLNKWVFTFYASDGNIYAVQDDGTILSTSASSFFDIPIEAIWLAIGVSWILGNYGCGGAYADALIYNWKRLSVAQWATWYDQLRSRYGMAARSGW